MTTHTEAQTDAELPRLALTVPETARALGISESLARQLVRKPASDPDALPGRRIGGRIVVPVRDLEAWLAARETVAEHDARTYGTAYRGRRSA